VPDLASGDLAATDLTWGGDTGDGPFRGWLVVRRGGARVVANLSDEPAQVQVPLDGPADLVEAWEPVAVSVDDGGVLVDLGPRSVAVLAPPAG
jgi:maltooligosyltrehalose trehalohydrolase